MRTQIRQLMEKAKSEGQSQEKIDSFVRNLGIKLGSFQFNAIQAGHSEDTINGFLDNMFGAEEGRLENMGGFVPPSIPPPITGSTKALAGVSTATRGAPKSDLLSLIQRYFPQSEWTNAYKVAMGESGGNPQAIGDQYPIGGVYAPSYGYFQIRGLPGRPGKEQLLQPEFNVQYAANMLKEQGWRPWTVAKKLGLAR